MQVQAQLDHLSNDERSRAAEALELLRTTEQKYLAYYAKTLRRSYPNSSSADSFESLRKQTISLLGELDNEWTPEVLATAREQIREDRLRATEIANLRASSEPRPE